MKALAVKDLSKSYSKRGTTVKAVDDINFSIEQGEVFGLIGANGAGKSTTFKCILGLIKPNAGNVEIFGKPSTKPSSRMGIASVAEVSVINPLFTPRDVLKLAASVHRVDVDNNAMFSCLERLSVSHVANKQMKTMSKGMAQRVAIASALVIKPKMMILDEPLSGLDPVGRKDVVDILDDYRKSGGTLLFTSHVLHDVERLADTYCLIHKGKIDLLQSADDFVRQSNYTVIYRDSLGNRLDKKLADSELWQTIDVIKSSGGSIVSINPELDLESYFHSIVTGE